ncbi:glycosyltransferase [Fulvivirgaceae bacterium BMA10]|uniref:Glycosyltransferase n=1 Tax=Splendidivirga corallicola TaxID=3051826 RepID=A0ABT8KWC4_9BACT|nr:glycosyltransferase [Fulvivirgaceae bacterium BMA10]
MRHTITNKQILFISSYPPRECGIATFCQDLVRALNKQFSKAYSFKICALEECDQLGRVYPEEVKYTLKTNHKKNYKTLATKINQDPDIAAVFIQHEFGLFSGAFGDYLLELLSILEKPIFTIFHTILPDTSPSLLKTVSAIAKFSERIIVMTQKSSRLLQKCYGIDPVQIQVFPHGTHLTVWKDKRFLKRKYGLSNRSVLSTFGLMGPNKNVETAIKAMPKIIQYFPNTTYLILGKTHPGIVAKEGEKYRAHLEELVDGLGLEEHVKFVNRYLSLEELLEYLLLTDIYLFTSKDPNQAVSGTFSYAMACGSPIISTPIPHALELIDPETGMFFDFEDSEHLSRCVMRLLKSPKKLESLSLNALHKMRLTVWENVAILYFRLLNNFFGKDNFQGYNLPDISLEHIKRLTTERGMIQFSKINEPDVDSGYTLDDNARALIALTMHQALMKTAESTELISRYLKFIINCQQKDGKFLNYVDVKGAFHSQNHYVNLEDSNARAIWALGYFVANNGTEDEDVSFRVLLSLSKALTWIQGVESPRAIAFIIKGLYYFYQHWPFHKTYQLIIQMANKLVVRFLRSAEDNWDWFEDYMTYANSIMPEALLYVYKLTGKPIYKDIAQNTMDFLISKTFTDNQIQVISNRGWYHKGKEKNHFGEQPIDVSYTIQTLDLFHETFHDPKYKDHLIKAFSWFLGNNRLNQIIYDPVSGGCYDGLEEYGPNLNQGAESTVCYLIARLIAQKYIGTEDKITTLGTSAKRSEKVIQ